MVKLTVVPQIRLVFMESIVRSDTTTRLTLYVPTRLVEAADQRVKQGKAKNRNDFIVMALQRELKALEEADIDADFAEMADDEEYQAEADVLEKEFAQASWEAFQSAESEA